MTTAITGTTATMKEGRIAVNALEVDVEAVLDEVDDVEVDEVVLTDAAMEDSTPASE